MLRVSENANQPPTDIAMLQARLATVLAERDAAIAERDQALAQNHRLQHLLHQLQRMQFGRRSEKLDADQLALAFEDVEQAVATTEAATRVLTSLAAARERSSTCFGFIATAGPPTCSPALANAVNT